MSDASTVREIQHPAPRRHRVSTVLLLLGIAAGPAVWSIQLIVKYALTGHYCYPGDTPNATMPPQYGWVWPLMIAIDVAALVIAAAAAAMSVRHWLVTREDTAERLIAIGEGRARFLAMWGILTSAGFFLAVVLDLIALFVVPLCG
jgi:hypothetical protein